MSTKIYAHSLAGGAVKLPSGEIVTREKAERRGFTVLDSAPVEPASGFVDKATQAHERARSIIESYSTAIMGLPEAAARPKAAAKIAEVHNAKSLPPYKAKALLASLPPETEDKPKMSSLSPTETAAAEAQVIRRIELRAAALSVRANRGDHDAKVEAGRLNYALQIKRSSPQTNIMSALSAANADVAAIRNMRNA